MLLVVVGLSAPWSCIRAMITGALEKEKNPVRTMNTSISTVWPGIRLNATKANINIGVIILMKMRVLSFPSLSAIMPERKVPATAANWRADRETPENHSE